MEKIKKNLEYQIFQSILKGKNNYQIIKDFKETNKILDKKKIKNIRKYGKWYIDLITNELVFTDKKISMEEQIFHYLCSTLKNKEENEEEGTSTILNRKKHKRVAIWITLNEGLDEEEQKKLIARCDKWLKKHVKLVGYDKENNQILTEILIMEDEFKTTEKELFSKSYVYDKDTGYPKGYKLFYADLYLKPYLLDKAMECIREYINFIGDDSEYQVMMRKKLYTKTIEKEKENLIKIDLGLEKKSSLDYLVEQIQEKPQQIEEQYKNQRKKSQDFNTKIFFINRYKIKIGMEIGKWGKEMLKKGYGLDDIYYRIDRRYNYKNIVKDKGTIDLTLLEDDVPRVIYIELGAYNDRTINEEMRKKVEETFIL